MAENPKLDLDNSCEVCGLEENMGTQKISVSDHMNGFQYTAEKSDSFVIDMDGFSHGTNKDISNITANSRFTLQRSLSRKGTQRDSPRANANNRDFAVVTSSPRGGLGSGTPEKSALVAVGTMDNSSNPQVHHQITITTGNTPTESRFFSRRNSFKPLRSPWVLDPKKVLFFFATLSSMGTILLIYFTLSIGKLNAKEDAMD